jgi:hypothetical protein
MKVSEGTRMEPPPRPFTVVMAALKVPGLWSPKLEVTVTEAWPQRMAGPKKDRHRKGRVRTMDRKYFPS